MKRRDDLSGIPSLAGLPLFAPPVEHLSARNDPPTSRAAAVRVRESIGKAQAVALAWVRNHPGSTAKELGLLAALRYGVDKETMHQRIGRRLNELKRGGYAETRGTEHTEPEQRWWAV